MVYPSKMLIHVQPKRGRHNDFLSQDEDGTVHIPPAASFSDGEDSEGEDLMENMQE